MKHRITRRRNKIKQRGGLKFGRIIKDEILQCISRRRRSGTDSITPKIFNECIMMALLGHATSVNVLSESTRYSLVLQFNLAGRDLLRDQFRSIYDTVSNDDTGYEVATFCVKMTFIAKIPTSITWLGNDGRNYNKNTMTEEAFINEVNTQQRLYESTMYTGDDSPISSFVPHLLASQIVVNTNPVFTKICYLLGLSGDNASVLENLESIERKGFRFGFSFMEMIPLVAVKDEDAAHHIAKMLIHIATTTRTILYDCNQGNFLKSIIAVSPEHSINRYTIIDLGRVCSLETTDGVGLLTASFDELMTHVEQETPTYPTFDAICKFFGVAQDATNAKLQVKARFVKALEFRNFNPLDSRDEQKNKAHRILMILAFADLMINKHVFGGMDHFQMEFIIRNMYSGEYTGVERIVESSLSGFLSIFSLDTISDKENDLYLIISSNPKDEKNFISTVENYGLLIWLDSYVSTKKRKVELQQPTTDEQPTQVALSLKTFLDNERERAMRQRRNELERANKIYSDWCEDIKKIHTSPSQNKGRRTAAVAPPLPLPLPLPPPSPPPLVCKKGSCVMMGGTRKHNKRRRCRTKRIR